MMWQSYVMAARLLEGLSTGESRRIWTEVPAELTPEVLPYLR